MELAAGEAGYRESDQIPTETNLLFWGIAAAVAVWLVLSIMKRMLGIALLAALAAGAWVLWNNPEMMRAITEAAANFLQAR